MKDMVMLLVFTIVLLIIMLYPSIKIAGYIDEKRDINQRSYLFITITIDLFLSFLGAIFLYYL